MRQKRTIATLLFLVLCAAATPAHADDARSPGTPAVFLKNTPDIPLMPGFFEVEDESLVFDKPDGKIAVSVAVSRPVPTENILTFYRQTLPQLGWTATDKPGKLWARGDERLHLSIEERPGKAAIRFELAPLTKITPQKPTSP